MEASEAFVRLQPFCVAACKERSAESLEDLRGVLDRVTDDASLQRLQDYVLFPPKLVLKLPTTTPTRQNGAAGGDESTTTTTTSTTTTRTRKFPREKIVESAIRLIRAVLKRTVVDNVENAVELFTLLLSTIGHPKNGGRVDAGVGEELKESVVLAVESVVRSCDDHVRLRLCTVCACACLCAHVLCVYERVCFVRASISVCTCFCVSASVCVRVIMSVLLRVCFHTRVPVCVGKLSKPV